MKAAAVACCLIIIARVVSLSAADPDAEGKTIPLRFVVYASEVDTEIASSLFRALYSNGKRERFGKAQTIEQAIESDAEVLILVLPTRDLPKLEKSTLESLKKRKIVGVGYGAAQLFGQLGLEINGGACAHGVEAPPSLTIVKSELLGEPKHTEPLLVLQEKLTSEPNAAKLDLFAIFLPTGGSKASVVDPIARWTSDMNYAPIVRQGNCILIGIPAPATQWTPAYVDLVREACTALQKRKLETYSTARWEVTKPGTYEFTLAPRDSIDQPFEKTCYFQFKDAKSFHARLEHKGSNSVMLLFMGQDEDRNHWARMDALDGEALEINAEISRDDIKKLGDRYWTLRVTNFGDNVSAECKLTITIEEPQ
ncbi:MAG: hypothetical protein WCH39_04225 [Schlesneria sp.]